MTPWWLMVWVALWSSGQSAATGPAAVTGSRTILYHPRDVVAVRTKVRFTTMIALPDGEEIIEATCGDKEFWSVHARAGFAYVKPAKAGSDTNLNLATASGKVYAFRLTEVSTSKDLEPDLAVYLEADDPATSAVSRRAPMYVAAEQLDDVRAELATAKADLARTAVSAEVTVEHEVTAFRAAYPLTLVFPYRFKADAAPLFIHAMFHDDHVTYLQLQTRARPRELPALYELKDGAPNLVSFEVRGQTYVVPKILDSGYLAIGTARWPFTRVEPR